MAESDKTLKNLPCFNQKIIELKQTFPTLFANTTVFIKPNTFDKICNIIETIEFVIKTPLYQQRVLQNAPEITCLNSQTIGVFMGYDFHIDENDNPQLIEINTNAGGGLLNAYLQKNADFVCETFIQMFLNEWHLTHPEKSLKTIAIVDESPETQFLYPEFLLFKQLFEQHNIECVICDKSELIYENKQLFYNNQKMDLVYNRLTDFYLNAPQSDALKQAYFSHIPITPNPRHHALYANKQNLVLLSTEKTLIELEIDKTKRDILLKGIAQTQQLCNQDFQSLWNHRKNLFFKPMQSYGSKAVYRGDKLTKRVFEEILNNADNYVTQKLIQPKQIAFWA